MNALMHWIVILGSELWEEYFDSLLRLVREYIVDIWETQKIKLYADDSAQSQSSARDITGIVWQSVKDMSLGGKISYTHYLLV